MKKQTKVLLAAAMMTMGATFSALAAETKGTWVLNEEGWQYADKDGEYMDNVWAKSNGIEYWVNDDEVLGSNEWVVEDYEKADGTTGTREYYVQSDGSKTVNAWKYLYEMDDEEEEKDPHWYYFDAKGRMIKGGKKDINGSTYYFNDEGMMLTGWVDTTTMEKATTEALPGNVVYTNENGAVVKTSWVNVFPWSKESDDCYEGEDEKWYYTTSAGKINANKQVKVDGLSYIFNANGEMLTKWVGKDYAGNYAVVNKDAAIKQVDSADLAEVYYCDADYGYVKKDGWREIKEANGDDTFWFHFDKLGRAFLATSGNAIAAAPQTFYNGETNIIDVKADTPDSEFMVNSKKIDGVVYYFNAKGEMIDGLQVIDGLGLVYLEGGARQTGKVTLTDENENDYEFYFGEKTDNEDGVEKYVAVTGAYKNYIYVNGQLITSGDKDSYKVVYDVNGEDYIVDHNGKIQHKDGKDYAVVWGEGTGKYTFDAEGDFITGLYPVAD